MYGLDIGLQGQSKIRDTLKLQRQLSSVTKKIHPISNTQQIKIHYIIERCAVFCAKMYRRLENLRNELI